MADFARVDCGRGTIEWFPLMVLCGVGRLVGDQQAGGWVGGLIGWEFFPEFVLCAKVFWVWGNSFVLDLWRGRLSGKGGTGEFRSTT